MLRITRCSHMQKNTVALINAPNHSNPASNASSPVNSDCWSFGFVTRLGRRLAAVSRSEAGMVAGRRMVWTPARSGADAYGGGEGDGMGARYGFRPRW